MTTMFGLPACTCHAEWIPAFQAELKRQKVSAIRFTRLIYRGGGTSGDTHWPGGGGDGILANVGDYGKAVKIARNMGAAAWHRTPGQGFIHHLHFVLVGCPHNSGGRYQIGALNAGYNGLGLNGRGGRDDGPRAGVKLPLRTFREGIAWAKPPKPPKPPKPVKPWFNVSFSNTHWNSVAGGKVAAVASTAGTLAKDSAAGSPAVATFSEVRQSQLRTLDAAMKAHTYIRVAYSADNMTAAYVRPGVVFLGQSFARFTKQDGGNKEGVLRLKFRIDGSRAQIGVLHLDWDSPETYKRHNIKQAYDALRRYGIATLLPDWKSRTLIIGDFNHKTVAAKVLEPLGFKQINTDSGIDQAWVGAKRAVRGGASSKTASDHPRILVRLAKSA